jgi:hypothetical protein
MRDCVHKQTTSSNHVTQVLLPRLYPYAVITPPAHPPNALPDSREHTPCPHYEIAEFDNTRMLCSRTAYKHWNGGRGNDSVPITTHCSIMADMSVDNNASLLNLPSEQTNTLCRKAIHWYHLSGWCVMKYKTYRHSCLFRLIVKPITVLWRVCDILPVW